VDWCIDLLIDSDLLGPGGRLPFEGAMIGVVVSSAVIRGEIRSSLFSLSPVIRGENASKFSTTHLVTLRCLNFCLFFDEFASLVVAQFLG